MKGRGVYVVIEGLDGSGKTTLFEGLCARLREQEAAFTTANPTKALNREHWLERAFRGSQWMQGSSLARAIVYARRSAEVARRTDWTLPLVLGDRSVVTSYVVRWRRWGRASGLTIAFVNTVERWIPAPDHVIYLDLPPHMLRARLLGRGQPLDLDETAERSDQMRAAYEEIIAEKAVPRLAATRWHRVDALCSADEMLSATMRILSDIVPGTVWDQGELDARLRF